MKNDQEQALRSVADEKFSKSKAVGYSLNRFSSILTGLLVSEVMYFVTNSLGITAALISAAMAVKSIIDAIRDIPFGAYMDRRKAGKYGKARPYILSVALSWVCLIALFMVPTPLFRSFSQGTQNVLIVAEIMIFLILATAVFDTMRIISNDALLKRCVLKEDNRVKFMTIAGVISSLGSVGLQAMLQALIASFKVSRTGFIILVLVTGVIGIVSSICAFLMCKEYPEEQVAELCGMEESKTQKKVPLKEFIISVLHNKYIFMWTLIAFLANMYVNGLFQSGQYFFEYVYGDLSKFSFVMLSSIIMFPVLLYIPKLVKKFGTIKLFVYTAIMSVCGLSIRMFFPHNFPIQMLGYVLASLFQVPLIKQFP